METEKNMKNLLISGDTNDLQEWDTEDVIKPQPSRKMDRDRLTDYAWENKIARNGMTYLEIEQFNNTFNNFK